MTDLEGNEVFVPSATSKGSIYKYFEDAKFLPGMQEIFNKLHAVKKRRYRYDIYKQIDVSYYGCGNDEVGILDKVEWPMEEEM
jgi:pre-mRNA-splicing factor ISY1